MTTLAICISALFASGADDPKFVPDKQGLIPIERNIVNLTNAERARYGLPALEVCPNLLRSARNHAAWMTRNQALQHTSQPVAENIAMGQQSSREALQSWMSSPGHRSNILNPGYRRIGAAAYRTAGGTIFWCQQFLH
ncbi:MAG: CAP domain-containing protein [Pirellulales bacterium]|nr:CAP domain-containing protein [Pirellulales bacterium]